VFIDLVDSFDDDEDEKCTYWGEWEKMNYKKALKNMLSMTPMAKSMVMIDIKNNMHMMNLMMHHHFHLLLF
jgi:hypothetical protein